MPKLVFHAGAAKTGTSAFQRWLAANRAPLGAAGVLVPVSGVNPAGNAGTLLAALAGVADPVRGPRLLDRFAAEVAGAPDRLVVLSCEALSGPRYARLLPAVGRSLRRAGRDPVAVMAVREQLGWINSAWAHMRLQLVERGPFADTARDLLKAGRVDWARQEAAFQAAGFGFQAAAFTAAFRAEGVVAGLARVAALARLAPLAADAPAERANTSGGWRQMIVTEEVRLGLAARGRAIAPAERRPLRALIERAMAGVADEPFNGFDPALRAEVEAALAPGNDAFAARHFGARWVDLFPPPPDRPVTPVTLAELPPAEADALRGFAARVLAEADAAA
jgi:hypothetical protein